MWQRIAVATGTLVGLSMPLVAMAQQDLFSASPVAGQRNHYQLPRILQQPQLDGVLDETHWQQALQIELKYENNPGEGTPAPVKTIAYLYEDGNSLHVAFRAYDPDPSKIRAYLRDRDSLWNDDNVGIIIDTFDDERSAVEFFSNPLGAQADMTMTDTNGWNEDSSWDAIWDNGGKIDEQGYVVEMSIPFRALRFPQTAELQTWNIALWRNYPRDSRHQLANYKPDRNVECNVCLFDKFSGFRDIQQGENLQLTPTLTTIRSDEKDGVGERWQQGKVAADAGLDLRWGITEDMVLNATVNPDFSQIEADSAQLDINNTFSLFYPERRPFFLDGASYFDTQRFNLVHTRNIADPDYGVKLTGKSDQHAYGVMMANDNQTTFLLPGDQGSDIVTLTRSRDDTDIDIGSDALIARYKLDTGERNNIGGLITNRRSGDYSNTVASLDGSSWLTKEDNFSYQLAYSDSNNPSQLREDNDLAAQQSDHAISLAYSHNTRDYDIRAGYTNIGADFRADLGFMSQVGYEKMVFGGSQTWYGDDDDFFNRWGYFGDWDKTYDVDGKLLEQEFELHGNLQGPMQFRTNFGIVSRDKRHEQQMFKEQFFMFWFGLSPTAGVSVQSFGRKGEVIDTHNGQLGDLTALAGEVDLQLGTHVQLSGSYEFNQLDVSGGQLYHAQISDVRLTYQFDMRSYIRLVVQYSDIDRDQGLYENGFDPDDGVQANSRVIDTQLLYSYKINPQTLFFLGYSEHGYQDDDLSKVHRSDRTLFAKFSYAWQM